MRNRALAYSRCFLPILVAANLSSCAGTTTQQAPLPPGAVEAEQQKQLELVLSEGQKQQARLDEITYPILAMGTSLCTDDHGNRLGLSFATVHDYPQKLRPIAASALGVSDTLTILNLPSASPAARAGLKAGDRIIAVGSKALQAGPGAAKHFAKLIVENLSGAQSDVSVMVQRGPARLRFNVRPDQVCDYGAVVYNGAELNAYADGKGIYVSSAMMRFVDDDELRVVVAHEFAHNAMGHIKAKKKNSLFGALLGALGDLAMASRGVNTGGYYTNQGAKLGAMSFSQNFEREADYAGVYALALADQPLSGAPTFWRRMAVADPKAIAFAHTHPTTAERFVRLEQAIYEVNEKIALKQPLKPDAAGSAKPLQQPGFDLANVDGQGTSSALTGTQVSDLGRRSSDSIGSARGYSESELASEPVPADPITMQLPGQPISSATPIQTSDTVTGTLAEGAQRAEMGDWLGQSHGRIYYWASCQAALELPEPIYFKSEQDAQQIGYRRSQVSGC